MSETQQAMASLLTVFDKYAAKSDDEKDDKTTMSKSELKVLLKKELGQLLVQADDKEGITRIFKDLDANGDDQVDFQEFGVLILSLSVMCHDFLLNTK